MRNPTEDNGTWKRSLMPQGARHRARKLFKAGLITKEEHFKRLVRIEEMNKL